METHRSGTDLQGWIYVPEAHKSKVIRRFHDNLQSGHFGAPKTAQLLSGDFHWPEFDATLRKYIAGCKLCHVIKAPHHPRHGLHMPLPPPSRPWEGVTMDIVTALPKSIPSRYTAILVIIDCPTEMVTYIACGKDIDSRELPRMFFDHVSCKQGVPDNPITNRGKEFTCRFWD